MNLSPLDRMLVHYTVGDRTSFRRHLPYLLCRFLKLSRNETPDGILPTFVWNDVAASLNSYPHDYHAAFAFSIFPYPQIHLRPLRLAFPCGRPTGLPRST